MRRLLAKAFGGRPAAASPDLTARLLHLDELPALCFVVGDIHGMLTLYRKLERQMQAEAEAMGTPALVVLVGDLIDRGPDSAAVIDLMMARPPAPLHRTVLMGNHEEMFLKFCAAPAANMNWLDYGGRETLASYGIYGDPAQGFALPERRLRQMIEASIPTEHLDWLGALPHGLQIAGQYFVSHSGIDPAKPLDRQTPRALMWSRGMTAPPPADVTVIHGHTPVDAVDLTGRYIDIDTGAYASGRLSALRLSQGRAPTVIEVT